MSKEKLGNEETRRKKGWAGGEEDVNAIPVVFPCLSLVLISPSSSEFGASLDVDGVRERAM